MEIGEFHILYMVFCSTWHYRLATSIRLLCVTAKSLSLWACFISSVIPLKNSRNPATHNMEIIHRHYYLKLKTLKIKKILKSISYKHYKLEALIITNQTKSCVKWLTFVWWGNWSIYSGEDRQFGLIDILLCEPTILSPCHTTAKHF